MYHNPVLLKESIDGLAIKPNGIYVDVTYGGGGHSAEILKKLKKGRLIAFESDYQIIRLSDYKIGRLEDLNNKKRLLVINNNFRWIKNFLNYEGIEKVDGLIADLGVSSYQIDTAERGFSTRFDGELDMRMNKNKKLTAKTIINEYSEEELKKILKEYGEINNAGELAKSIINKRALNKIETTGEFVKIIESCNNFSKVSNFGKVNKIKAKVFQAIRIVVNDEMESLKEMLLQTIDLINTNGRLVVISYHSLEDRLVKNFIRSGNFEGEVKKDFYGNQIAPFKQVNRNIIISSDKEISENSRARSAKLRIAERI